MNTIEEGVRCNVLRYNLKGQIILQLGPGLSLSLSHNVFYKLGKDKGKVCRCVLHEVQHETCTRPLFNVSLTLSDMKTTNVLLLAITRLS